MLASPIRKPQREAAAKASGPARAAMRPVPPWEGRRHGFPAPRPRSAPMQTVLQGKSACDAPAPAAEACENGAEKEPLQRKLAVGSTGDPLEHEADRVAEQVLAAPARPGIAESPPAIQRAAAQPAAAIDEAPASVHEVLASAGRPLDAPLRQDMEGRFGCDFSQVRIHDGAAAAQSARDVNALAYTVGRNIVFGAVGFAPDGAGGRSLLAHELTHVVQQGHGNGPLRRAPALTREAAVAPESDEDVKGQPKLSDDAKKVADALEKLIAEATWEKIRARVYPVESASGIKHAQDRRSGLEADLSGLGSVAAVDAFVAKIRTLIPKWSELGTKGRVREIEAITAESLTAVKVPPFRNVRAKKIAPQANFEPDGWNLELNETLVSAQTLDEDMAAKLANTVLHECRHAEQEFLAARFSAGSRKEIKKAGGKTDIVPKKEMRTGQIRRKEDIPRRVARKAVQSKFGPETDTPTIEFGQEMYEAMVTRGQRFQSITDRLKFDKLEKRAGLANKALEKLNAKENSSTLASARYQLDALQKEILRVETLYGAYRDIPYEVDAHEVGDAAEEGFKVNH